jgi:hypothetical protein
MSVIKSKGIVMATGVLDDLAQSTEIGRRPDRELVKKGERRETFYFLLYRRNLENLL